MILTLASENAALIAFYFLNFPMSLPADFLVFNWLQIEYVCQEGSDGLPPHVFWEY